MVDGRSQYETWRKHKMIAAKRKKKEKKEKGTTTSTESDYDRSCK
jgi:hypothetical protein